MPSLVEIGPVVLEKKILKSFQCIFTNSQLSPGSGEEDENVKSLQTDGQTDRQTTDDR